MVGSARDVSLVRLKLSLLTSVTVECTSEQKVNIHPALHDARPVIYIKRVKLVNVDPFILQQTSHVLVKNLFRTVF